MVERNRMFNHLFARPVVRRETLVQLRRRLGGGRRNGRRRGPTRGPSSRALACKLHIARLLISLHVRWNLGLFAGRRL